MPTKNSGEPEEPRCALRALSQALESNVGGCRFRRAPPDGARLLTKPGDTWEMLVIAAAMGVGVFECTAPAHNGGNPVPARARGSGRKAANVYTSGATSALYRIITKATSTASAAASTFHCRGLQWRSDAAAKIKRFEIGIYIRQARKDNIVWHAIVALSTGCIGLRPTAGP